MHYSQNTDHFKIIFNSQVINPIWGNYTGGGQKLRTGSLVFPVADNIFKWMYFASVLLANGS